MKLPLKISHGILSTNFGTYQLNTYNDVAFRKWKVNKSNLQKKKKKNPKKQKSNGQVMDRNIKGLLSQYISKTGAKTFFRPMKFSA